MFKNELKEKMKTRPVFGMTIYTGSPAIIEAVGHNGLDFVFIDTEHSSFVVEDMRECVLAARMTGVSPLVRVSRPDEIQIRKALEMGAEGVIVPHVRNRKDAEECVRGARFPQKDQPLWRRGYDGTVRSAGYGTGAYNASDYIRYCNETELVLPMAEDFEFLDNIDEILAVPGIDAINFGPADYAMSLCIEKFYDVNEPNVRDAMATIASRIEPLGIALMAPAIPPTAESIRILIERGVNMVIVGSDMYNFNTAVKQVVEARNQVLDI